MQLFQTKRLTIRQLVLTDIDEFFDMQSSHKVMGMVPDKVMTLDECKRDLDIRIENYSKTEKLFDVWAVIDKNTNDFVGTCGLVYINENSVEIGYRFREKYWGNGIGTEVAIGLVDYIFKNRSETKIVADVSKTNIGSTRILEKIMIKVGESFNKEDNCIDLHFEINK